MMVVGILFFKLFISPPKQLRHRYLFDVSFLTMAKFRQESQKSVDIKEEFLDYNDILNSNLFYLKKIQKNPELDRKFLTEFFISISWIFFNYVTQKNSKFFIEISINIFKHLLANPSLFTRDLYKSLKKSSVILKIYYLSKYRTDPELISFKESSLEIIKKHVYKDNGEN
jgi:hypothetical protein